MQPIQFERWALVDIVADLSLISQNCALCARLLCPIQIGGHAFLVQAVGSVSEGQILFDQPAIKHVDPGHFLVVNGHQDETIGLQRFVLTEFQLALNLASLVHKGTAKPLSRSANYAKPKLDIAGPASRHYRPIALVCVLNPAQVADFIFQDQIKIGCTRFHIRDQLRQGRTPADREAAVSVLNSVGGLRRQEKLTS